MASTALAATAPISLGAERVRRAGVADFTVADLRFPAGLRLEPHAHDHTTLAVIVSGGFDGWWNGREAPCEAGTLVVEPAGERHANHFAPRSATRVLTLQTASDRAPSWPAERQAPVRHAEALPIAWRMADELHHPDAVSPLALEGLALELLAVAARQRPRPSGGWPARVAELIEERFAEPLTLSGLAAELGMHPSYVARGFRAHHGRSLGTFLREIRVRRAAERLAGADDPVADVALSVGFADQSHLTRWFVRYLRTTPARYRRELRDR